MKINLAYKPRTQTIVLDEIEKSISKWSDNRYSAKSIIRSILSTNPDILERTSDFHLAVQDFSDYLRFCADIEHITDKFIEFLLDTAEDIIVSNMYTSFRIEDIIFEDGYNVVILDTLEPSLTYKQINEFRETITQSIRLRKKACSYRHY